MSIESAKAFIEKMNTDAEFAKRAMEQRGKEQIAAFLKAEGYEFSEVEFCKEMQGSQLSDEQLDAATGGGLWEVFPDRGCLWF